MGNCQRKKRRGGGGGNVGGGYYGDPGVTYNRRQGLAESSSDVSAHGGGDDISAAGSDLVASMDYGHGGHGGGGYGHQVSYGYVHEEECPEGIDEDLALLLTAAAIAAGAFVVYRDITLRLGKRKKRETEGQIVPAADAVYAGKEEENAYHINCCTGIRTVCIVNNSLFL